MTMVKGNGFHETDTLPMTTFPGNIFGLLQLYAVKGATQMKQAWLWLVNSPTDGPKSTLLLRLMAGGVFFWEGLLKFVYVNQGVGRFTKLGIPFPHFTAAFVAYLEIFGGLLLLTGLMTRLIAIPFIAEMIVAILSTKISLYLGTSPLPLPPAPPQIGFWAVLHEIRSDYAQIVTVIFLLINGPGKWSLDAVLIRKWRQGGLAERVPSGRPLDLSAAARH
ncbi:MAG: DoxX family protein [Terriglobales bacterium]